jgi:hypothetical protein
MATMNVPHGMCVFSHVRQDTVGEASKFVGRAVYPSPLVHIGRVPWCLR